MLALTFDATHVVYQQYLLYVSYYIKTSKLWIKMIKPLKYVGICLVLCFVLFVSPVCHVSPSPRSQCQVHVS